MGVVIIRRGGSLGGADTGSTETKPPCCSDAQERGRDTYAAAATLTTIYQLPLLPSRCASADTALVRDKKRRPSTSDSYKTRHFRGGLFLGCIGVEWSSFIDRLRRTYWRWGRGWAGAGGGEGPCL